MPSVEFTERDLRRDEARLLSILTGGPAPAEAELPAAAPARPRVPAWLAALVLTGAAAAAGIELRSWIEPLVRRVPPAPRVPISARPIPLAAPPLSVASPPSGRLSVKTVPRPPRPIATVHAQPRHAAIRKAPEPAAASAPPSPAPNRWIAEPLYGEALEHARAEDAARTRDLNRGELGRLPPAPDG